MTETLGQFWNLFIVIPSVLGLLGCAWLVFVNSRGKRGEQDETMGHVWDEDLEEFNNPLPRWWLNMFYITLIFGAIYLVLYPGLGNFKGLLGWTQIGQYKGEIQAANEEFGPLYQKFAQTDLQALTKDDDAMKAGQRLFSTYCATCHGSDARGAVGFPNLRDNVWQWGGEPAVIKATIMNGRTAIMPAWAKALKEDERDAVAEYVRSLGGNTSDAEKVAAGAEKYKTLCVACHGAEGKGNPALGAPNLTDANWLYGGSKRAIIQTIENGRQGKMPAHGEFLGEAKVHLLAAYIYSLSQSGAP
ncbi:MAG: cytochrome-c oxidase, cbb3-type subunit III [Gammaproteobacteria bacterium]|nr:cytochrome-c oxidase, cbb3-type subunit III [Gammaproteobacteria bacterium]